MNAPPTRSNHSIGWLRFFAWITPSVIVPAAYAAPLYLRRWIPFPLPLLSWALPIGALISLAYFDSLLKCQQQRMPREDPRARIGQKMTVFVALQLVIIPVLWFAVAFSYCALSGFNLGI